jgi:hypothetical protein
MRIVSQIKCRTTRIGGEQHRGWVGGDCVTPMPSSPRDVEMTFEIRDDTCGAFLLSYYSRDNSVHGFTSHQSVENAKEAAHGWFAIQEHEWQDSK